MRLTFGAEIGPHGAPFRGVAREPSASPATGSSAAHRIEQAELLARALDLS
jgi:2-oxoglutarate dehydrogenase complex dehydrogenase (E1) component-like enzyme